MAFVAGPYKWKYANVNLGVVGEAPRLEFTQNGEPITSDLYGGQIVDYIRLGHTATLDLVFQELTAEGVRLFLNKTGGGNQTTDLNNFGRLESLGCPIVSDTDPTANDNGQGDVLWGEFIPELAQCATGYGVNNFASYRAALAPGVSLTHLMGSRLRNVPVRFTLFPYYHQDETLELFRFRDTLVPTPPLKSHATDLVNYLASL